jgi:NADH-quinone oxidoreductase subunit A
MFTPFGWEAIVIDALIAAQVGGTDPGTSVLMSYVPIVMVAIAALGIAVGMISVSSLFGQRKPTREKLMPYECGKDPVGSARERHSVRFYLVAMIFLLFDIEAIFLIPWAVAYGRVLEGGTNQLMLLFWGEMMAFIAVLFIGLIYVWKKGLLEWNR